jgi:hypothetical protein
MRKVQKQYIYNAKRSRIVYIQFKDSRFEGSIDIILR